MHTHTQTQKIYAEGLCTFFIVKIGETQNYMH